MRKVAPKFKNFRGHRYQRFGDGVGTTKGIAKKHAEFQRNINGYNMISVKHETGYVNYGRKPRTRR